MSGHPTHEEDFDLYALGATEGEERAEIERHVATCDACARKLAAARGRVAMLAMAAPSAAPPAGAKARLMARIRAEEAAQPVAAPAPSAGARGETRGLFANWWTAMLVPAAGVLAIATLFLWQQNENLNREIATLRDSVAIGQAQLSDATKLVDLIGSADTVTVDLAAQPGMPKGVAHVMYNMKMGMMMYDGQLAPAPAGKSYQLWVVPAQGNPISAGVFQPAAGRPDHWMMSLPQGVAPKAFAVTIEPAGGMPQPTGPKVLVGVPS